jgi:hypothetical protein
VRFFCDLLLDVVSHHLRGSVELRHAPLLGQSARGGLVDAGFQLSASVDHPIELITRGE